MNTIGVVFLTVLAVQCGAGESLGGLGMFCFFFPVYIEMRARSAELSHLLKRGVTLMLMCYNNSTSRFDGTLQIG